MLSIKDAGPRTPQMPEYRWAGVAQAAASILVHVLSASAIVLVMKTAAVPATNISPLDPLRLQPTDVRHLVFIARAPATSSGGGGGGGNRQMGPIRRAHGVGADAITLRASKPARPVETVAELAAPPSVLLDAKPLVSGLFDQIGLPDSGVEYGTSTGPGSGGGVGTGTGTGIGSGEGPGLGPGSDGGVGGGIYRTGGAVTAPRALVEVKPTYTSEALRSRIQGTVVLEFVVTREGRPSQIHVVRSLDRELDQQAIDAASQWRFEPGRLAGEAVNVLVTLMLDFRIR